MADWRGLFKAGGLVEAFNSIRFGGPGNKISQSPASGIAGEKSLMLQADEGHIHMGSKGNTMLTHNCYWTGSVWLRYNESAGAALLLVFNNSAPGWWTVGPGTGPIAWTSSSLAAIGQVAPRYAPAPNILPDSGRFAGKVNPQGHTVGTTFVNPTFFTTQNGATVVGAGKFIHNNVTYIPGGSGALTQDVIDLLTAMQTLGGRTEKGYGAEFHIASYTMGSSNTNGFAFQDGVTRYPITLQAGQLHTGPGNRSTAAFWIRLKTVGTAGNKVAIRRKDADAHHDVYKNDVKQSDSILLTPADGWTHIITKTVAQIGYDYFLPYI